MKPSEEFTNLIAENCKANGFDSLTSKIIAILYTEPKEISLNELATRTKYSLSAISTSMKMMRGFRFIKRTKKAGSRKVYFYMEKNLMKLGIQLMKRKYEKVILPSKEKLPEIIKKLEKTGKKDQLKIAKEYQNQINKSEKIMSKLIKFIELFK
jgi:HTH-type transcriptional regulator, osmoprotectant uptake regulator